MIKNKLKEHSIFVSNNCKYLPILGFKWKRVSENRNFFIERNDIQVSRAQYLRKIKAYREKGYQIVYLDETWINTNHHANFSWMPDIKFDNILEIMKNKVVKLP